VNSNTRSISAFVAPVKNYDLILGRDNLLKLNAVIDVNRSVEVFDKKIGKRTKLQFGKDYEKHKDVLFWTKEDFNSEQERSKDLMIFEVSVEELVSNTELHISEGLGTEESVSEKEKRIKEEFGDILRDELPNKLPPDRGLDHYIDLQGRIPRNAPRPFRLSEAELEFMQGYIQELLDKGLIQPCLGPYASPILVVKKPNSTDLRCVIDYRKVNECTVADEYPQPMVTVLIDKLKNAKYFSKMDLLSGFHQIRMASIDEDKTAFRSPFGTYSYKVMPLGLKNASKTFQRMVEYVLRKFIDKSVIVFVDDILVYSDSKEGHEKVLREVLETLRESELYLKTKKCEFFRKEVTFLGHVISHNKVAMDPKKVQVVREWGPLETKKDVQRFLGFANFYRRFVKNFAKIASPLNKLLVNTPDRGRISMNEEALKAKEELIEAITDENTLAIFDSSKELKVVTDASGEGLGAILMQRGEDKIWRTVEFQSRSLDGDRILMTGEYRLAPRDLELVGISYALEKFRAYLAGNKFTVTSDHRSLEVLEKSKINNGRLARILEQLSEFDFKIEYSEGTSAIITVADALSRLPKHRKVLDDSDKSVTGIDGASEDGPVEERKSKICEEGEDISIAEIMGISVITGNNDDNNSRKWGASVLQTDLALLEEIREGYKSDPEFAKIRKILKKLLKDVEYVIPKDMKFKVSNYAWNINDKLLYRRIGDGERLCIPEGGSMRLNRLLDAHATPLSPHFGREKTLANVARHFFWPGMTKDVEDFVKSCNNCQRNKAVKRAPIGLLYPHDRPQQRWEKIALDFIVQLPVTKAGKFDAILTVVDFFSRRTHFIPCNTNVTALKTAQLLREHVIKLHGYPKCMVSDRGSIFTSEVWSELCRCLRTKQNLSSSFHPQTDGISEKENDIIESCIRAFTNYQQNDWDEYLPDFELAINASISDSTGLSPYFVDVGWEPFIPLGITREVNEVPVNESAKELLERLDNIKIGVQLLFAKAQEKQAEYANKKRRDIEFVEGDFVLLNSDFVHDPIHTDRQSRKLAVKWLGPFRIIKKVSRVAYKIFIPKDDKIRIHPVVHIANLKKYVENPEKFLDREGWSIPQPVKDSQNETVYLVDDILAVKTVRGKREFLIKWTGYEDPSWETESLMRESIDFAAHVDEFLESVSSGTILNLKRRRSKRNAKGRIK